MQWFSGQINGNIELLHKDFIAENDKALGISAPLSSPVESKQISTFLQTDKKWGSNTLGNGSGKGIYKLETQKYKRYTDFFKGLDHHVYRDAVNVISDELKRLQKLATEATADQLLNTFNFTVHPREAIIRFREPRGRLTDNPEQELADLFANYVEFGFLRNESAEQKLVKRIHDLVKTFELKAPFKEDHIGNSNFVSVQLQLVQTIDAQPVKAIKPLHLGQAKINDIYSHSEQ